MALLLTFAAGCVDIVGYLALYHTFTAHMTGVTVHLAESTLEQRWMDAAYAFVVIAAFVLGSIAGRSIIEIGARRQVRNVASANLLVEGALIVAVTGGFAAHWRPLELLAMLTAAMGMQTATLTRIGSLTVHTTFVTGMLNKLAQLLSHAFFLGYDRLRGRESASHSTVLQQTRFIFSVWVLYLTGAAVGTWLQSVWHIRALLVPVAILALAVVVDQAVPLSIEEEHDQVEPVPMREARHERYRRAG